MLVSELQKVTGGRTGRRVHRRILHARIWSHILSKKSGPIFQIIANIFKCQHHNTVFSRISDLYSQCVASSLHCGNVIQLYCKWRFTFLRTCTCSLVVWFLTCFLSELGSVYLLEQPWTWHAYGFCKTQMWLDRTVYPILMYHRLRSFLQERIARHPLLHHDMVLTHRNVFIFYNDCTSWALEIASKETGLEVNAEITKYMVMSRDHNAELNSKK